MPTTRHHALPVLEYRGNMMALQATRATRRCCRGLVESAGTQQLCRGRPAHTCTCTCCTHASTRGIKPFGTRRRPRARVRVERLTSRSISLRPLRALTPVHGRDLAWAGLWQVRRIQVYESCAEQALARALRTEQSTAKMAMESGRDKWYRIDGFELRKGWGAPLTQEDSTLTAQRASARCILLDVRVEHGRSSLRRAIHDWQVVAACACVRACERACACVRLRLRACACD